MQYLKEYKGIWPGSLRQTTGRLHFQQAWLLGYRTALDKSGDGSKVLWASEYMLWLKKADLSSSKGRLEK